MVAKRTCFGKCCRKDVRRSGFAKKAAPGNPVLTRSNIVRYIVCSKMSNRTLQQFLQMLASAGVSHLPTVILPKPTAKPRIPQKKSLAPAALQARTANAPQPPPKKVDRNAIVKPETSEKAQALLNATFKTIESKSEGLQQLAEVVCDCKRCPKLAESRTQTVFGVGNPNARIMFIGEAPGADEDRQGEPFVGAAGQLLDKIIAACDLKREDIYICNVLRCRPPGNRNPLPQEAANCREFLDGQIRIVNPEYIVCWGTVAAQNLLNEKRPVGKLRGQFLNHGDAKVLCTYHPSYLLRNPSAKKQVWTDMQFFMEDVNGNST